MNQKVVKKLPIPIHCPVLPTYGRKVCSEVEVVQKYAAIGGVRTCMFVYRVSRVKWNKSLIMLAHASCFHSFPTTTNMLAFSTTPVGFFFVHLSVSSQSFTSRMWKSEVEDELLLRNAPETYHLGNWSQAVCFGNYYGLSTLIYCPCATGIPKAAAAAVLYNKNTDNSSEAHPCLFRHPTCLKCSCLSVVHKSCRVGSGHAAKSSILRDVFVCQWVGGYVHVYVCAARFSCNFKSSFGCAW